MKPSIRSILLRLSAVVLLVALMPAWRASAAPLRSLSLNFTSVGAKDGLVRESSELSGVGGSVNSSNTTFLLGDDASNRQVRAILHFNTASIPDTATSVAVKLKIKRQALAGTDPFASLGVLRVDIRKQFFGASDG